MLNRKELFINTHKKTKEMLSLLSEVDESVSYRHTFGQCLSNHWSLIGA